MNGYANVYYDSYAGAMALFTWDDDGKKIRRDIPYKPYVYIENENGNETSIFGTKLEKRTFSKQWDRSKFVKESGVRRIFYNLPINQQFLIDEFIGFNEQPDFNKHKLHIQYLDIEVLSKHEFPHPQEAKYPISLITIHDTYKNGKITFGLKPYTGENKVSTDYIYCKTEHELLEKMICFIEHDHPHVISGWNTDGFDIPYILNRIINILGEDELKRLSPVGKIRDITEWKDDKTPIEKKLIEGIHLVDYMDVYKKFGKKRESYKLDFIGEVELGYNKLDYGDMSLYELAETDWNKFVDYNVVDVDILVKLDDKLRFFTLLRMISTIGLTTLSNGLSSLNFITGSLAIFARNKGLIISTFVRDTQQVEYEGGYVKEPIVGIHEKVVSFDANSLHPNIIITLNISPETKVGKIIEKSDNNISIRHVNGKIYDLDIDKFKKFINKEKVSISSCGVMFSQKRMGILAEMVEYYYNKRVSIKNEMKQYYKSDNDKYNNLDNIQGAVKIIINSVYGATASRFFCFYDIDMAESITATSRAMIKQAAKIINNYINNDINNEIKQMNDINMNHVIYSDTDSIYLTVKHLWSAKHNSSKFSERFNDKEIVTPECLSLCKDLENHLNTEIKNWASKTLRSTNPTFVFKRESICPEVIFLAKKKYVLHYINKEGNNEEGFKYVGVEVVQTVLPKPIKNWLKKIIECLLITKQLSKVNEVVADAYKYYDDLKVEEISNVSTANNVQKWESMSKDLTFGKGTPAHVKAALSYNKLLEKFNIKGKYEPINSSEKVKYFYVEPNAYGLAAIGYKYKWPTEFDEIFKPDKNKLKLKQIYKCISRFYDAVGWSLFKPNMEKNVDLFSFLLVDDGVSNNSAYQLDGDDDEENTSYEDETDSLHYVEEN